MERDLGDVGDTIGKIAIWRISRNCWGRGGENLAMDSFHVLVLTRSRGFGDKQPPKRSWATSSVMIRFPDEGETITSIRPSKVAFYEAAFPAGLRFPLHNTIRLILQFYNICPAQLVPNAWRSIACSMALWRARNKKVLLGGYPSNVKGWKSKFFFVSGDEWEIPEGVSRKGAARVPRTWGIPDKHCNNPLRLYGDEPKVFEEIFQSIEKSGRFSVPVLLDSKSFGRVFGSPGSRASRTVGGNIPSEKVPRASSDMDESKNPHEQAQRESPSRDDSIECLGSIRTNLRRLLPHIPDLTLLRWSGGKVLDPILDHFLNAPSLNSLSESSMSKRVSFKKIGEKLGKAAGASSGAPVPAKGVVIGEKRPGESVTSSPSKKGKVDDGSKGKGVVIGPEGKKKATSSGIALPPPATASPRPGEGSSANLGTVLGPTTSMLGSPSVAKKLLRGVIPLADKEKMEKLTLDQTTTKLFHLIGQLVKSYAREQQANDELAKAKSDRDSLSDKFERSGVLVNELREALNKSKEFSVEEFKSSSEFMVAVKDSASKYFGEGFNFCKV
ncbi:hypothetical protein Acr_29g0000380 [Actinidia rufa]|uniref:Transposase (putative) gypsy type domain-containing protein n=1 Tax=Actinidia rufa TaxID=165716 RepID=A0A7J0HCQ1_9ERIC|nr:hypothetical protein Acr_29g0000380 [Actinidia rufa]